MSSQHCQQLATMCIALCSAAHVSVVTRSEPREAGATMRIVEFDKLSKMLAKYGLSAEDRRAPAAWSAKSSAYLLRGSSADDTADTELGSLLRPVWCMTSVSLPLLFS